MAILYQILTIFKENTGFGVFVCLFPTDQGSSCVGVYHTHLTLRQVWSQQDMNLTVDLLLESSIMQALTYFYLQQNI